MVKRAAIGKAGMLAGVLVSRAGGKAGYSWAHFRQFCRYVGMVIGKSGKIIRNKPYFYKVI